MAEKKYHYVIVTCKDQKMFDDIAEGAKIPMLYTDGGKLATARQWQVVKKVKKGLQLHVRPYDN